MNESTQAKSSTPDQQQLRNFPNAINGTDFNFILNAPWLTLAKEGKLSRGEEAEDFAKEHNAKFGKIVDSQIFVSPFAGSLLFPAVEKVLDAIPQIPDGITHITIPLDRGFYVAQCYPETKTVLAGTEAITDDFESIQHLFEQDQLLFVRGGLQSEDYDAMLFPDVALDPALVSANTFRRLQVELVRNALATRSLLTQAGAGALVGGFGLYFAWSALFAPPPPFVPPPPPPPGPPMAVDLAPEQLLWAQQLFDELSYFANKHINNATITPTGVTISGQIPNAATLHQFVGELAAANIPISFGSSGWSVSLPPPEITTPAFLLGNFNESYVTAAAAAESHGFSLSITSPTVNPDNGRLSSTMTLVPLGSGYPGLTGIAEALRGHATSLNSITLQYNENVIPTQTSISLTLEGLSEG